MSPEQALFLGTVVGVPNECISNKLRKGQVLPAWMLLPCRYHHSLKMKALLKEGPLGCLLHEHNVTQASAIRVSAMDTFPRPRCMPLKWTHFLGWLPRAGGKCMSPK